jgi:ATP-dependent helicase Lhr and Lhr-like helicase
MTLSHIRRLKLQLRRTWPAFFIRFGHFHEIQARAIPVVLSGKNAVLVSSTASGKTEAVVAPLCERILSGKRTGLSVLYITPTRALANDLLFRLKDQLETLEITIAKKSGDSPYINWEKVPDILITTPESLDSILCRHPTAMKNLMAVILDEIHLIDGNPRGDQLRLLLRRLREITPDFNVYALSATICRPEHIAYRYIGEAEIIRTEGTRQFIETYVPEMKSVYDYCKTEQIRKLLIFSNSRKNAELMAREALNHWDRGEVFVHHGMLDRKIRLEAEESMKSMKRAVCSSTMTLEIGIDIGDVDAVVLAEVPFDVITLLQRIGRAGRRTGNTRVFALAPDEEKREDFSRLFEAARKNMLEEYPYHEDYSVVIQQIYSMLFARRGIPEEELIGFFQGFCPDETMRDLIIPHLIKKGKLIRKFNNLYDCQEILDMGVKGMIHSNIPDTTSMEVVDTGGNRTIGEIAFRKDRVAIGERFVLGSRVYEIVHVQHSRISVKRVGGEAGVAYFPPVMNAGSFIYDLPEGLRAGSVRKRR